MIKVNYERPKNEHAVDRLEQVSYPDKASELFPHVGLPYVYIRNLILLI